MAVTCRDSDGQSLAEVRLRGTGVAFCRLKEPEVVERSEPGG
jgi:hypothetical protein